MAAIKMSLYVTSVCNLECAECIMQHTMQADPKYQMSLEELQALIEYGELSGYQFDFVLTGGEPLLWKYLPEGLQLLRTSRITKNITMFSNGMFPERVTQPVADALTAIRLSEYLYNADKVKQLQRLWPRKVSIVERTGFWKNPTEPVPLQIALPVECMNPEVMYYNGEVYACPHNLSLAKLSGSTAKLSRSVRQVNFLVGLPGIKKDHQHASEICTWCISNNKIRKHAEKTLNYSVGREDLSKVGIDAEQYAAQHGMTVPPKLVQLHVDRNLSNAQGESHGKEEEQKRD